MLTCSTVMIHRL